MTKLRNDAAGLVGIVLMGLAVAACSSEERPTDSVGTGLTTVTDDIGTVAVRQTLGPSLYGSIDAPLPQSLDAMAARADVIAVIEPEEQLPALWDAQGMIVTSRYRARVIQVLKGDLGAGGAITLHANGGTMSATFAATESQRPVAGEPTRVLEYVDSPFYTVGRQELVFLVRVYSNDPDIGTIYWAEGPGGRYVLDGGRLVSIFAPDVEATISEGAAIRKAVSELTLDELAARISQRHS